MVALRRASVCTAKKGWIESMLSCNVVAVRSFTRSANWKSIQFALFEHYIMLMRTNIQCCRIYPVNKEMMMNGNNFSVKTAIFKHFNLS